MSYCVNCGVELASSEKICPLCGVEVINPAVKPVLGEESRPYPKYIEEIHYREIRIATSKVIAMLMSIPFVIVLLMDFLDNRSFSWSLLPAAGIALIFMMCIFPCMLKRPIVWLFILFGALETAVFLFIVWFIYGGSWLFLLALPLLAAACAFVEGCYLAISAKRVRIHLKTIIVLLACMVFAVCVQILIELYLSGAIRLSWSVYVAITCGILSITVLIISRLYQKNESFKKRIFY